MIAVLKNSHIDLVHRLRPYAGQGGVARSLVFHVLIVGIISVGLPHVQKDPPVLNRPIEVQLVALSGQTQAPRPPSSQAKPKRRAAVKMTAKAAPNLAKPAPAPVVEKRPPPKDAAPPLQPVKKPPRPSPVKPKAPEDKEKAAPPQPPEEQGALFSSLLKNLAPDAQEDREVFDGEDAQDEIIDAPRGESMTVGELDSFRHQLGPCWNVRAGVKYAENLLVEVKVFMNADRTVARAALVDQIRYNTDSHFRAASDAALRALRNPACQPFDLPDGKYAQWREMTIRFNPSEML